MVFELAAIRGARQLHRRHPLAAGLRQRLSDDVVFEPPQITHQQFVATQLEGPHGGLVSEQMLHEELVAAHELDEAEDRVEEHVIAEGMAFRGARPFYDASRQIPCSTTIRRWDTGHASPARSGWTLWGTTISSPRSLPGGA